MNDKEFKDLCTLVAVLGLSISGEQVELVAPHALQIVDDLMTMRKGSAETEAGIVAIRKRTRRQ